MAKPKELSTTDIDSLKKIGSILKNRREELSCTIQRAADITRISSHIVLDLENGNYKDFPTLVFLRGFIRAYCKFLELDAEEFVAEINRIFLPPQEIRANDSKGIDLKAAGELSSPVYSALPQAHVNPKWWLALLGAVALFGIIYFLYSFMASYENSKAVSQTEDSKSQSNQNSQTTGQPTQPGTRLELAAVNRGWVRIQIDDASAQELSVSPGQNFVWEAKNKIQIILSRGDLASLRYNSQTFSMPDLSKDRLTELTFPPR